MSLSNTKRLVFTSFITTVSSIYINTLPVKASLVGDSVNCDINATLWNCSPSSTIVKDSESEFTLVLITTPFFEVDIDDSSIVMTSLPSAGFDLGGEFLTLSNLDWVDFPGEIVDFSLEITSLFDIGMTESNISFTSNSVGIDFFGTSWTSGDFITISLETEPISQPQEPTNIPEPSSIIGLGVLVTFGIGTRYKCKLVKSKKK